MAECPNCGKIMIIDKVRGKTQILKCPHCGAIKEREFLGIEEGEVDEPPLNHLPVNLFWAIH